MRQLLVIAFLLVCAGFGFAAHADVDCGSTNEASPCTGTSHTHTVDGTVFSWAYTCGGGACQHGRFLDGTGWVKHPSGGSVSINTVTPDDANSGLEKNPATGTEATSFTQGLYALSTADATYSATLDISDNLPVLAPADDAVYVKVQAYTGGTCGYVSAVGNNCINTADALTVLSDFPADNMLGSQTFRPGMAGDTKLHVTVSDLNLDLLPRFAAITAGSYATIKTRWGSPWPMYYIGKSADHGRRWTPRSRMNGLDYAADKAERHLIDLFGLFSSDALTTSKREAVYAMVQMGIDIYSGYLQNVEWLAGAGQAQGFWHPMVFFGALYEGASEVTVKANISGAANNASMTNDGTTLRFTELHQIRPGINGLPIWGGHPGSAAASDGCKGGSYSGRGVYWSTYVYPQSTGKRACGDPFGYIDGPGETPGSYYAQCCSTGMYVSMGLIMKIWPEFREVANYDEMMIYAERVMNGAGWWTSPDNLAREDPRESPDCNPYTTQTKNATCLYFGNTYGEDLINNDGTAVTIAEASARGHPSPTSRWPTRHLNGRPVVLRSRPADTLWDVLVPRTGNEASATGTITNDD